MAYNPPIGSIYHLYTTYILPSGGLYATYHLLGEPETTIDLRHFDKTHFSMNYDDPDWFMMGCLLLEKDSFVRNPIPDTQCTGCMGVFAYIWVV